MKFFVGIPTVNERGLLERALDAIDLSSVTPERVLVVDNGCKPWTTNRANVQLIRPERNLGCGGSWNLMHRLVAPHPIVIINDDCEVGQDTFERMLKFETAPVVLAHGYSCFVMKEEVWETVGEFDDSFYPAYWEDTDYLYRLKLLGIPHEGWDWSTNGIKHGKDYSNYQKWCAEKRRWFQENLDNNRRIYEAKWGGEQGKETFTVPYNGGPKMKSPYFDPFKYGCSCECI